MREIGFVTYQHLGKLERAGASPEQCVERIMAEAKERHPNAGAVSIVRQNHRQGFAIMAVGGS